MNGVDQAGTAPRIDFTTHISAATRQLVSSRDWLHVIQPPAYAPDLNPTEGVWSHVKRSLGNLAVTNVDHLAAIVRNRLKRIQHRPDLLAGFLAQTASPSTRSHRNPDNSTSVAYRD
ncbi:transposase [Saccharothrix sp. ALI-22-I]|uniref:transposase n=1 Tax=Saccharothrix sp. ALI-22-I TaxID=1933778 RepID=UPI001EE6D196|nr:transposase [Saccharothrix sp. ALI-22-I]